MGTYLNLNNAELLLDDLLRQYNAMQQLIKKMQQNVDAKRALLSDDIIASADELLQTVNQDMLDIKKHIEELTGKKLTAIVNIHNIQNKYSKEIGKQ